MSSRVVLVTGVSRLLGAATAHALAQDPRIDRVIGVDIAAPHPVLAAHTRAEFVRVDIGTPLITKVIDSAGVDSVVHTDINASPSASGGRASMKESNVMSTLRLLAACQHTDRVSRLVVKSSGAVYGSGPSNPAMFTEQMSARALPGGYGRDVQEVEGYVRGFMRRRPGVAVSVLRFSNFVGPRIDALLAPFFQLAAVPMIVGFNPRLQLIHEDDAVRALTTCVLAPADSAVGVFNIASPDVITLSQAIARSGRIPLPVVGPAATAAARVIRLLGFADFTPEHVQFLKYGRAMDTTAARTRLGFTPVHSTVSALEDYLSGRGIAPTLPVRGLRSALRMVP